MLLVSLSINTFYIFVFSNIQMMKVCYKYDDQQFPIGNQSDITGLGDKLIWSRNSQHIILTR